MELSKEILSGLFDAAALSRSQLERLVSSEFGSALPSISNSSTLDGVIEDIIDYAVDYGLTRQVASIVIQYAADRPGLQNWLQEKMPEREISSGNGGYQSALWTLRIENKIDLMLAEQARQATQIQSIISTQAAMDGRLLRLESSKHDYAPLSPADRFIVAILSIGLVGLFLYTLASNSWRLLP